MPIPTAKSRPGIATRKESNHHNLSLADRRGGRPFVCRLGDCRAPTTPMCLINIPCTAAPRLFCNPREALYVLDDLLENDTILKIREHTTDACGFRK
jgi:hypothetical protein